MNDIAANLETVRQRILAAVPSSGEAPPKLVAVSKGKPVADIEAAIAAGQRVFGENRVQEAMGKFSPLREIHKDLELHLIGPLQTNKAEDAVALFDVIETLDRPRLADALAAACKKTGRKPHCYIEVNSGSEPQKAGIAPTAIESFLDYCRHGAGLDITGLMCIPPQNDEPATHFARMLALGKKLGLPHLSMGMSGDFEIAIRHGATDVRVGTAIFGAREATPARENTY